MSIPSFDLNLLLVLDTVLSERSVARAARLLHVTPSAISNALARLRVALHDPLIVRSGRGIVPTPLAAALGPTLARALGDIDRALHAGAFDPALTTREFSLAISDAGQLAWLPTLAVRLAAELPKARLRVVGIDTLVTRGGLAAGEIDVAIGLGARSPGIHMLPVCEERRVLVVRRDHPIVSAKVSRALLATLRHVDVQVTAGTSIMIPPRARSASWSCARPPRPGSTGQASQRVARARHPAARGAGSRAHSRRMRPCGAA